MIEIAILSSLIYNEDYARKVLPYIKREYFQDVGQQVIYKLIRDYYLKYNKIPTKDTLEIDIGNSALNEHIYNASISILEELGENLLYDNQWLSDSTEQWCKKQALFNAIAKSATFLENSDSSNYGQALDLVQDALSVSFDTDVGLNFTKDINDRVERYHEKHDQLPCDLDIFNDVTLGGFRNKTLTVFLAPTGVGKSLFLCHFASSFLLLGKNVFYITLEMSEIETMRRIDANLLDIPISDLGITAKSTFQTRLDNLKKKNIGNILIKEFPARISHSGHFRHAIKEAILKEKFTPDVIIVDYIGIASSATVGKNATLYDQQRSVAEEIRSLGQEFSCRVFTAAQVNREGVKASDFQLTDIADSWGIANTGDYSYGIISTEELKKRNQVKIKRLKDRYNDYVTYIPSFLIGIDYSKMRLYNADVGIIPDEPENKQEDSKQPPVFDNVKSKFASLINTT